MKILIISQQYWPGNWRIVDIAEELVKRGHSVTVLCGYPNDSSGKIPSDFPQSAQAASHNGVSLIRVHDRPRSSGNINLFLNYISFDRKARKTAEHLAENFDVVLLNGLSPVLQCEPGLTYAAAHHKKTLLYCLDLWPISLTARGVKDHGIFRPIYRHYLRKAKTIYQTIDRILISSPAYESYFVDVLKIPKKKITYLPQFAENLFLQIAPKQVYGDPSFRFLFAGNIGKAQDVETLVRAAKLLKNDNRILFQIVGDGSDFKKVQKLAKKYELANLQFLGRLPLNQMKELYQNADGLILTLGAIELTPYVVPGKMQSYLASGRPIFVAADGAAGDLVRTSHSGFAVPSGDAQALAAAINGFIGLNSAEQKAFGNNGRQFYLANFGQESFFTTLTNELNKLC